MSVIDRRDLLRNAAVVAGALAVGPLGGIAETASAQTSEPRPWSDPATWGGSLPRDGQVVRITEPVLLDDDVDVGGLEIRDHGALVFHPGRSVTLRSSGNVIVRGGLVMRPDRRWRTHRLRFTGVNEESVVGGGMAILDTDVGLWVTGDGVLDLQGTPLVGWSRSGWHPSWRDHDVILQSPVASDDFEGFVPFSRGDSVPVADFGSSRYEGEVLNLSRNVIIEGTVGGRAHVTLLHARRPQSIRHVLIRHMGPRKVVEHYVRRSDRSFSEPIAGRYGLHFHHCGDGVRGTIVEGVVVRECGNHAFVPHASHGITFRDCIAFDTFETAYWWDPDGRFDWPDPPNASFDITFEHCMAALVQSDPPHRGFGMAGFELGQGERNAAIDCVAVGVQGTSTASGFNWPSSANLQPNVWRFEDCVAHNNRVSGIRVWQNGRGDEHLIDRFVAYHNGLAAVDHGAYINRYTFRDVRLHGNRQATIVHHALGTIAWERPVLDGAGISPHVLWVTSHANTRDLPVRFVEPTMTGYTEVPIVFDEGRREPSEFEFVRAQVGPSGRELRPEDLDMRGARPGTVVRVQPRSGRAWQIDHRGDVRQIPSFAP